MKNCIIAFGPCSMKLRINFTPIRCFIITSIKPQQVVDNTNNHPLFYFNMTEAF